MIIVHDCFCDDFLTGAKIVQGERNSKSSLLEFALPSRSLSWVKPKIVQGERNSKSSLLEFALPSRSLSWVKPKIVKKWIVISC